MSRLSTGRGITPTVGVIIMVAITLVLAIVVGGFVVGLPGTNNPAAAGLSVNENEVLLVDEGYTNEVHILGNGGLVYELENASDARTLPVDNYTAVGIVNESEQVIQSFDIDETDATADGEYGLRFDSSHNDQISIDDSAYRLDPNEESFTISVHVEYHDGAVGTGTVFLRGHTIQSTGIAWRDGNIRFGVRDSNSDSATTIEPIDWDRQNAVLVTVVFDATTEDAHLYINDEYRSSVDYSDVDGDFGTAQTWDIGGNSRLSGNHHESDAVWAGDDARFYDRALTASEIEALDNGENVTAGLIGHWPMNEGSGDSTENRAMGTYAALSNTPQWTTPLAPLSKPRQAR